MEVSTLLAGYSLGQADILRRLMSKKDPEKMALERDRFVDGCASTHQIPKDKAEFIFDLILKFAGYGFNKSHAVAYALLSWRMAFLKAVHPGAFFAAALTSEIGATEKVARMLLDARRNGLRCLPPDVNRSESGFAPEGTDSIRFALGAIKGIGADAVDLTIAARAATPFSDLANFLRRARAGGVKGKDLRLMATAGALDSLGDRHLAIATIDAKVDRTGTMALFGDEDTLAFTPSTAAERVRYERELLGCTISTRPTFRSLGLRPWLRAAPIRDVIASRSAAGVKITACVFLSEVRGSKQGDYTILTLLDETGSIECSSTATAKLPVIGSSVIVTGDFRKGQLRNAKFEPLKTYEVDAWIIQTGDDWNEDSMAALTALCRGGVPLQIDRRHGAPIESTDLLIDIDFEVAEMIFDIPGIVEIKADVRVPKL